MKNKAPEGLIFFLALTFPPGADILGGEVRTMIRS